MNSNIENTKSEIKSEINNVQTSSTNNSPHGSPSSSRASSPATPILSKRKRQQEVCLIKEVRLDGVGHLPDFDDKPSQSRYLEKVVASVPTNSIQTETSQPEEQITTENRQSKNNENYDQAITSVLQSEQLEMIEDIQSGNEEIYDQEVLSVDQRNKNVTC
ncbi:hypothetical protein ILUMI_08887 [Ignelater luminosus]|uniref:Uncharacterized protein n=1 Tax=Ignelater luminosus TaxID=2038154 RepID=A0A8K0D5B3_IGNLU|nr:hypothetical protein ILUMI_08887 [Ignelater luminosus]